MIHKIINNLIQRHLPEDTEVLLTDNVGALHGWAITRNVRFMFGEKIALSMYINVMPCMSLCNT
jgi:hypothetical protein